MSGKPIDYAALAAGVQQHIRFRENSVPRVPSVAELREWADAFDKLAAAQQQGQAVAEVKLHDGLLYGQLDADLPVGTKLYAAPQPMQQGGGEVVAEVLRVDEGTACVALFDDSLQVGSRLYTAPPSAPVGVEADKIGFHTFSPGDRFYHAADNTWWRKRSDGRLTQADPPLSLAQQPAPSATVGATADEFAAFEAWRKERATQHQEPKS